MLKALSLRSGRFALLCAGVLACAGCSSTMQNTNGFLGRIVDGKTGPANSEEAYELSNRGADRVKQARDKLADSDFKAAIKLAAPIGDKNYNWFLATGDRYKYSHARPEALFILGEANYQLRDFPKAEHYFQALLNDYPNPPNVEIVTQRMFSIARTWLLRDPGRNPNDSASGEQPTGKEFARHNRFFPNWFDRSRPQFDTQGRALNTLKTIWLKDPTGGLADDAIMLTGNYHLASGNHREADHFYAILRNEYPDSPHVKKAFEFGSYVKLANYQGAAYDGSILADANQLRESTQKLFPDSPEAKRLGEKEKQLREAAAARRWERIRYYRQKNKAAGIAINCQLLIRDYPETRYARMAGDLLKRIDPKIKKDLGLVAIPIDPKAPKVEPPRRGIFDRFRLAPKPDEASKSNPDTVGEATLE